MENFTEKEFLIPNPEQYSEFGKPYPGTPTEDPLACCMPYNLFTCENRTAELGLCPNFMSQRCAQKWDDKCDLYLSTTTYWKDFLEKTAEKKFCKLSKDSHCTKLCQPFDPIAQESPQVCDFVGNEITTLNINDPSGENTAITNPTYMKIPCNKTCDLITPDILTATDPVITNCLNNGQCSDILANICDTSVSEKINIAHPELAKICKLRQQNKDAATKANIAAANTSAGTSSGVVQPKLTATRRISENTNSIKLYIIAAVIICLFVLFMLLVLTIGYKPKIHLSRSQKRYKY